MLRKKINVDGNLEYFTLAPNGLKAIASIKITTWNNLWLQNNKMLLPHRNRKYIVT